MESMNGKIQKRRMKCMNIGLFYESECFSIKSDLGFDFM